MNSETRRETYTGNAHALLVFSWSDIC